MNIFRFRDRTGILDDRSRRFRSESAIYDQSLLEKPSFPQGRNCILHFDANIFAESLGISIVEGCSPAWLDGRLVPALRRPATVPNQSKVSPSTECLSQTV